MLLAVKINQMLLKMVVMKMMVMKTLLCYEKVFLRILEHQHSSQDPQVNIL